MNTTKSIALRVLPFLSVLITLLWLTQVARAAPAPEEILSTLKPTHPRILLDSKKIEEIRQLVERDKTANKIYRQISKNADAVLTQKPLEYELRDGRRLIYVSGDILERVRDLSFVHLLTGEKKYADRVWVELESAAGFKDWNPAHFLDTAIMTKAFALGLDWLWDEWTPAQRQTLRQAIVKKGLTPAMKVYTNPSGWHKASHNWNQVCNGGIALGALAVADTDPVIAGSILRHAIESVPRAMKAYAPDGASHEGSSYWSFGSLYNIMLISGLESALGKDFGLSAVEGFRQSGDYQIYLSGTRRVAFDFGDCGRSPGSTPQHLWMGKRYAIPRFTWFRSNALSAAKGGSLWDLLWLQEKPTNFDPASMPTDKYFRGIEVASMRDSWNDGEGFIVAMQGGSNSNSHRHLDLGSFILEANGVRWIIDSGKERETYQRHRNKADRNDFYRVRAEGHNTLVINPDAEPDQNPRAEVAFTEFVSKKSAATATLDVTEAYTRNAEEFTRTFELQRGKHFTVTDKVVCKEPSEIWSFFHTEAEIELSEDKRTAILRQDGQTLTARLGLPANAIFRILPAKPFPISPNPHIQASNQDRRRLAVGLAKVTNTVIAVRFELPESTAQK